MRQIVLDTETTGLETKEGHRIIEIGAVEIFKRRITGKHLHFYINPQREIDAGALAIHGISNQFLADKPLFTDVVDEFIRFIDGTELIIHNAAFDVGFLDYEFRLAKLPQTIKSLCEVTDTLLMARQLHPGQKNSLDALCKRYSVDNSNRALHGALLDANILARVYLAMTGGQCSLLGSIDDVDQNKKQAKQEQMLQHDVADIELSALPVVSANEMEVGEHQKFLQLVSKKSSGKLLWQE